VLVYDHGFAKGIEYAPRNGNVIPINKTSVFTQDDLRVYAYVTAALYNASFTWQWFDPSGQLYLNRTNFVQCQASPCTFVFYSFFVAGRPAAARAGTWRLDLLADGYRLYSDYFSILPVLTQDNYWNFGITQSAPPIVHGNLTVTIHPNNQTWQYYSIFLPGAVNITATDLATNSPLQVTTFVNSSRIIVDFGKAQSNGYMFVINFYMLYALDDLGGYGSGNFAFTWQEYSWQRSNDYHTIPEKFTISLPPNSTFVDIVGSNVLSLSPQVSGGGAPVVSFDSPASTTHRFGWTVFYHDYTYRNSHPSPTSSSNGGLALISNLPIPILPLTLGSAGLWTAVMSVFLLTASELLSPIYSKTGVLINRKRLRIAALVLVSIFIITTAYQIFASQALVSK
jgi:hypothetical protein